MKTNPKSYTRPVMQLTMEDGKLPPQAPDLEVVVLGALMLEADALMEVMDIIKAECFYDIKHQTIYRAILRLSSRFEAVDMLTIVEELRRSEELDVAGGAYYITSLTSKVASATNIEHHARIITQKYIQRELIMLATQIHNKSYDPSQDVDDLLDFSEKGLFEIAYGNIKKESIPIDVLITKALKEVEEASKRTDHLSGCPSGFVTIDRVTLGWQKSDLIIIAARPSMGKTAFVLSMARNIAVDHKRPVAFFSLEMSSLQLVNRLIVSETELPSDKLRTGKLEPHEWQQLEIRSHTLSEAKIFIDDTPALSIFELRAKCRRLRSQHQIELVIIDYLQLMTAGTDMRGNREQEVSMISRSLKALAKELDVPVIALSQLNRSVESRQGGKPMLSDLRESGAIEQDADIVMFIHRPERAGVLEDELGNSTKNVGEIVIAKHRNGAVLDVRLKFINEFARFEEWDQPLQGLDDFPSAGSDDAPIGSITYGSKMNTTNGTSGFPSLNNTNFDYDEAPF